MPIKVHLITPPFTQLNTPYPATAYLKGFLDSKKVESSQSDLSIELFHSIFTKKFIESVFSESEKADSMEFKEVWSQREEYISKVDVVIQFLKQQEVTKAYQILLKGFLPIAHRGKMIDEELDWAFGNLGILDRAKHFATIFIEELGDFIQANVDHFFSFTKYAEQIASAASSFDEIEKYLSYKPTIIEEKLIKIIKTKIEDHDFDLICFTIPFPGNLFSALRCAQFIKSHYPNIKIAFGGGYCNTELRSLTEIKVFEYVDFISLDDGEASILSIIRYLEGSIEKKELERTYVLDKKKVRFINKTPNTVFHHKDIPAPSYVGLIQNQYLSFLDVMNPMHRLWSDGRWNKMTVSHGCYWKKCTFCDTSLDYIKIYQNTTADNLVNKIQKVINETGITGFHFVDEAAPPKVLKALAEKLIEKKVFITWWTNIRFEKTFDKELCALLAKSGCIAVTGGLEVASDRLLQKMKKGVDIGQVARVTNDFAEQNIMVHAYLMYGFPTETEQETIDSLEIVRQLFENQCIHSAFWHLFTTTVHSPIGKNPELYDIEISGPKFHGFAQNDLTHIDKKGAEHKKYTTGLNVALHNYLNGLGLDLDLQEWFDFKVPKTTIDKKLVLNALT